MLAGSNLQRALLLLLVSLVAAIVVVLVAGRSSDSAHVATTKHSQFDGPTLPPGLHAANFSLTDQNGRRVTLSQYQGRVVVLTFIHSLCHDTCPFMVEQIKGALNDMPQGGHGIPVIGVSVAPGEDTVHNRDRFLAKHQMTGRIAFVNGKLSAMRRVWHAYAIEPVTPKLDHSTFVMLIDKRGIERVGFPADQLTPEGLAHDIGVLENEPA